MRTTLKYLCLVCVTSLLAACGESDGSTSMKGQVLEKVQSPDGLVAATSTREAGDEDAPASYRVYIEKSRDPAQAVEVMEADRSDAPRLRWLGPGDLQIAMECGQIHHFANFADVWSAGESKEKADQVLMLLDNQNVCPVSGEAAPAAAPANP